jgi:lipooligosaccharide transport system ATP-binding protein
MDEAAQMADRVGVMEKGRLVAEDTPAALVAKHVKAFVLEIPSAPPDAETRLAGTDAVLRRHGDVVAAYHDDERVLRAALVEAAFVRALVRPSTLEDVFLELTGRHLDA